MYLGGMVLQREATSWAHNATIPAQRRHQRIPGYVRGLLSFLPYTKMETSPSIVLCVCAELEGSPVSCRLALIRGT